MSTLIFQARSREDAVVLTPHGEVDAETQQVFEATVRTAVMARPVVVDLSRLRYFALSALDALTRTQLVAEAREHRLLYVDPPPPVRMMLTLSGVDQRIEVLPATEGARPDPAPEVEAPTAVC